MQQLFAVDALTLLFQLVYYFPRYVMLVLIPMAIRVTIERAVGIRPEDFEDRMSPLPLVGMSYERAFGTIAITVLYYPLFEELVFRGLPYLFFGPLGVIIGSTVWVALHPAWQLQYLALCPLRTKLLFTATTTGYYAAHAAFYSMVWLDGAGLCAILYHVIHNGWLTIGDMIKKVELPAPWKRYKYVRKPVADEGPRLLRLFRREKRKPEPEKVGQEGEPLQLRFVVRKPTRSLSNLAEEAKGFMFVRKKVKSEEG